MTFSQYLGLVVLAVGALPLGGWFVSAAVRRWDSRYEDPAMYLYVALVGVLIYFFGGYA